MRTDTAAAFAITVALGVAPSPHLAFAAQKTMYGGRRITAGSLLFVFDAAAGGGAGLCALAEVTDAQALPRPADVPRHTPRVSIRARRLALPTRTLGRSDLRGFSDWGDGRAETELNFKFYRQATPKIVGLSPQAAAFLAAYFPAELAAG